MNDEKKIQLGLNMSFIVQGYEYERAAMEAEIEKFKSLILNLQGSEQLLYYFKHTVISKQEYNINE